MRPGRKAFTNRTLEYSAGDAGYANVPTSSSQVTDLAHVLWPGRVLRSPAAYVPTAWLDGFQHIYDPDYFETPAVHRARMSSMLFLARALNAVDDRGMPR